VLLSTGNGTFQREIRVRIGGHPDALTVIDWNTDGLPDLAVLDRAANVVQIVLNAGDGNFLDLPEELRPLRFAATDALVARHRSASIPPTNVSLATHLEGRAAAKEPR
jgi:hypothetical protein